MKEKEYVVEVKITHNVVAESEEEAEDIAWKEIDDYFRGYGTYVVDAQVIEEVDEDDEDEDDEDDE